jgi:hypothetical protein
MGVFTPAQRESHTQTTIQLIQEIQSVQEVEKGYQFTFPNETEFISRTAEFISNERLCCPFLKFSLNVVSNSGPISFLLTGHEGTQEFLRAEFNEVFI